MTVEAGGVVVAAAVADGSISVVAGPEHLGTAGTVVAMADISFHCRRMVDDEPGSAHCQRVPWALWVTLESLGS